MHTAVAHFFYLRLEGFFFDALFGFKGIQILFVVQIDANKFRRNTNHIRVFWRSRNDAGLELWIKKLKVFFGYFNHFIQLIERKQVFHRYGIGAY